LGPIPNPQSPIPNPQFFLFLSFKSKNDNTFLFLLYLINKYNIFINDKNFNDNQNKDKIIENLITQLNHDYKNRNPKYILLSDFFINKYCNDINSYLIFQYYQQNNISDAYYIINEESLFYQSLLEKNQTNNLIPINPSTNYWDKLYNFILNSKIIIQSYIFIDFQKITFSLI
jgi:hypothetical protein